MIESNEQIEPDKRPWLLCQDMSGACFSPNQGHTWLQQLRLMLVNVRNLGCSVVAQITSERKFLRLMLPEEIFAWHGNCGVCITEAWQLMVGPPGVIFGEGTTRKPTLIRPNLGHAS